MRSSLNIYIGLKPDGNKQLNHQTIEAEEILEKFERLNESTLKDMEKIVKDPLQ